MESNQLSERERERLDWIVFWLVMAGRSPRQPAEREDKPNRTALFFFSNSWRNEKNWRKEDKRIDLWVNWWNGMWANWGMKLMKLIEWIKRGNEMESMNGRAVRRRTTQPKPTILCGWAWKASKELVWLLRLALSFQSIKWNEDWLVVLPAHSAALICRGSWLWFIGPATTHSSFLFDWLISLSLF